MKTLFHRSMFVLLLIGTQLFFGCEKNPKVVPPVVLQPTVELTITPTGTLNYGDNCTITWISTNANGGVWLNNQNLGISGAITKKLFRDTTFILRGVNGSLTATNQKDVTVGNWTTSKYGMTSYYPWKTKALRITKNGIVLSNIPLSDEEKQKIIFFHKNGTRTYSWTTVIDTWEISPDGTKIILNNWPYDFFVSDSEMTIYQNTDYNGQQALFETVCEHASNIPTDK